MILLAQLNAAQPEAVCFCNSESIAIQYLIETNISLQPT